MPSAKSVVARVVLTLAATALLAPTAWGQFSTYPGQTYFRALDELHSGDFNRAARAMQSELRTSVKTVDSRWLDSICFHAGLGEALYQQGRLVEALAQFDAAIDLFLSQATWMRRIQWQQSPREDISLARRMPAWAVVGSATYADMPRSFLYQQGQVDNTAAHQQGGVVQAAQFWKLDCEELSRAIAWSLYRRGDMLGPLGAYDARAQAVATRLAGGGLGPAGHWTAVWPELWWGLAKASTGDTIGALPHLRDATLLGGRMQHRLTGLALLTQGRLTAAAGDGPAAGKLLQQAISAAVAYEDFDVLAEATRALHELSLADATAPKPPLAQVVAWTEQAGLWRVSIDARLGLIENAILAGDSNAAKAGLSTLFRRSREASGGWMGREAERLAAIVATAGSYDAALAQAQRAIANQQKVSLRLLQTQVANAWFDEGRLSKRLARQAYISVLGDPGTFAWQTQPLDAVAAGALPLRDAFDRWFAAAMENRDPLLCLRVIDQQRRREVFVGQPMAGRLVAVQWLLEASDEALPAAALAQRAQVEAAAPEYRQLRSDGAAATSALRAAIADSPDSQSPAMRRAAGDLRESVAAREGLALRVALSRTPTPLVFPPSIDPAAAKQQLTEGEALLVFHESAGETYGVVLTAAGEHVWRVGPSDEVADDVERLLKEIVGSTPKATWTAADLSSDKWREAADALSKLLFAESRLDAATLQRLWVVPDGPLWRAPLSVLTLPGSPEGITLADVAISYAPTPGWATRPRVEKDRAQQDTRPTWAIVADPKSAATVSGIDVIAEVAKATPPPQGLDPTTINLKATAGQLVIDVGNKPAGVDPLGLPLSTADRGQREVGAWIGLPLSDPTAVVLRAMGGGEAGGAKVRRAKTAIEFGAPELHVVASLLAGGAEPILVERWPSGGSRSRDYIAEWLSGLRRLPATEAWDRARRLLASRAIDAAREPRLAPDSPADVSPEHPVWWAGFFVVD
jgi:tetratricopeptide (TPR) repeat protein